MATALAGYHQNDTDDVAFSSEEMNGATGAVIRRADGSFLAMATGRLALVGLVLMAEA